MKKLLVFGATGRTGRHFAPRTRAAGWRAAAAVRDPARAASWDAGDIVLCDALVRASVGEALAATRPDAVVSLLGGRSDTAVDDAGVRHVADACASAGVRRLVVVTSLGCGASRAYASARLIAAIGEVLAAKTRAEEHIATLDLDWTIVRPGGLIEAEPTGGGRLVEDETVHGLIACADLAALIAPLIDNAASARRILSAVDPSREAPAKLPEAMERAHAGPPGA